MVRQDIQYTATDFDTTIDALQAYVKANRPDLWTDFTTANIGEVMLEMIAYISELNSYANNRTCEEMFITACRWFETMVRHARDRGYSITGLAPATVELQMYPLPAIAATEDVTVIAGTTLSADGKEWIALVDKTVSAGSPLEDYFFTFTEGEPFVENFVAEGTAFEEFETNQTNVVDNSWTIEVNSTTFTMVDHILAQTATAQTYEKQFKNNYKVLFRFGDGTTGLQLTEGDIVTISYRTCTGTSGNTGANVLDGNIEAMFATSGIVSVPVYNGDPAGGGYDGETLESIRINAPNFAKTGEKYISLTDYNVAVRAFTDSTAGHVAKGIVNYREGTLLIPDPGPLFLAAYYCQYDATNFPLWTGFVGGEKGTLIFGNNGSVDKVLVSQSFSLEAADPGYSLGVSGEIRASEVHLLMRRYGSPGDVRLTIRGMMYYDGQILAHDGSIYYNTGGDPTAEPMAGVLLGSTQITEEQSIGDGGEGWVTFRFDSPLTIKENFFYWIVLELLDSAGNPISAGVLASGNYYTVSTNNSTDRYARTIGTYPGTTRAMFWDYSLPTPAWVDDPTAYDWEFRFYERLANTIPAGTPVEFDLGGGVTLDYTTLAEFELLSYRNSSIFQDPNSLDVWIWIEDGLSYIGGATALRQALLTHLTSNSIVTVTPFIHAGLIKELPVSFTSMHILPDYDIEEVMESVRDTVIAWFRRSDFNPGDTVYLTDLIAVVEGVEGVDNFIFSSPTADTTCEDNELITLARILGDPNVAWDTDPVHTVGRDEATFYGRY